MKNYKNGFALPVIFLVVAIVVIGGVVYFYKSKQSVTDNTELSTAQDTDAPIKILSTEIPNNLPARKQYDSIYDCQPENFDPNTSKIIEEGVSMEQQSIIDLGGGYTLTPYEFWCASSYDYVLEIKKDSNRHALYTHVSTWEVSPDKESLFLYNYVKNQNEKYEHLTRIIDIQSKQAILLPNLACSSRLGFWNKNNLTTYSDLNTVEYGNPEADDYVTKFCQWSKEGELLNQFSAKVYWGAASAAFLSDKIGFLPADPDVFYVYSNNLEYPKNSWATSTSPVGRTCYVYLQDITNQNKNKKIKVVDAELDSPYCPKADFNLSDFEFNSDEVDYTLVN